MVSNIIILLLRFIKCFRKKASRCSPNTIINRLADIDSKSISAYRLENIRCMNQLLFDSQSLILLRHTFIVIKPFPADHKRPIAVTESSAIDDELSISPNMLISIG